MIGIYPEQTELIQIKTIILLICDSKTLKTLIYHWPAGPTEIITEITCKLVWIFISSRGRTYVMITYVSKENNLGPDDKVYLGS